MKYFFKSMSACELSYAIRSSHDIRACPNCYAFIATVVLLSLLAYVLTSDCATQYRAFGVPLWSDGTGLIYNVSFHDSLTGWAATSRGPFLSQDGGNTWRFTKLMCLQHLSDPFPRPYFHSGPDVWLPPCVRPVSALECWAVAGGGPHIGGLEYGRTSIGVIAGTTDAGSTWICRTVGHRLNDIDWASPTVGFAVGDWGTIARTVDGGVSWTLLAESTTIDSLRNFKACSFLDSQHGIVVGTRFRDVTQIRFDKTWTPENGDSTEPIFDGIPVGTIWRTQDGGTTWLEIIIEEYGELSCAAYVTSSMVFVGCKQKMLRSTDGGDHWEHMAPELFKHLKSIPLDMHFLTTGEGWVVSTAGFVARTADFGDSWETVAFLPDQKQYEFSGVSIVSHNLVFVSSYVSGQVFALTPQ